MAKRLIDQAALIEDIEAAEKNAGMGAVVAGTLKRYVKRQPTVDAVEVVRCRDCKHYFHYGKTSLVVDGKNARAGWCQRRTRYDEDIRMLPDDFCSYGERKEG